MLNENKEQINIVEEKSDSESDSNSKSNKKMNTRKIQKLKET